MAMYKVVKQEDGTVVAHGLSYQLREGEEETGEVEAANVEAATRKARKEAKAEGADEDAAEEDADADAADADRPSSLTQSREPSPEEVEAENDRLREAEESKEEFEVMADGKGGYYVAGDKNSDPAAMKRGAKAAKSEPPAEPEPASLGTFRAKNAAEAIKMAKGEYADPAAGPARGAQTP